MLLNEYKPILFQIQILTVTEKVKIQPYHCQVVIDSCAYHFNHCSIKDSMI